jgi:histidinol-phosphate aminotransferase
MTVGRPRPVVESLPAYRPGKGTAQAEAEHGITDAIKLASNENPMEPVAAVQRAIAESAAGANRYADHRATELRQTLAYWLGVGAGQVTVGCGSVGLLQQLLLTYVDPGDEVVYPWRSFEVYPVYTTLVGGVAVTVPLVDDAFDLDAVATAVTPATKLVLLATPNNPTGTAVSTAQLAGFMDQIGPQTIVVIDEAYREFVDPALGDPVTDILPNHRNAIVLRTFSKAHGLAGLRVGYAIGDPEVITAVDKTLVPFAVNGVAQAAAIAAIGAIDEIRARVSQILEERARVVSVLRTVGWQLPEPQANFVYLPLGDRTDEVCVDLERRGVVTRPFSGEGLRVTIGSAEENERFLSTLGDVASP